MLPHAEISIATLKDTTDWSFGKRLFETLIEHDVRFTPVSIDSDSNAYAFDGIDSVKKTWEKTIELIGVDDPDFHLIAPYDFFGMEMKI